MKISLQFISFHSYSFINVIHGIKMQKRLKTLRFHKINLQKLFLKMDSYYSHVFLTLLPLTEKYFLNFDKLIKIVLYIFRIVKDAMHRIKFYR